MIKRTDGENGADLYRGFEYLTRNGLEAEHVPRDHEMACGGDRQEFCNAFDNAEDQGLQKCALGHEGRASWGGKRFVSQANTSTLREPYGTWMAPQNPVASSASFTRTTAMSKAADR